MTDYFCVRDGLPYVEGEHPIHPEDAARGHPMLSDAATLERRMQQHRGLLDRECPVCRVRPGVWCVEPTGGENAPATHPERLDPDYPEPVGPRPSAA